ncbi:MAG: WD40/YVTN/BNR-like repeat-containing protein, partial [Pyrinomonadaceae bacterium]
TWTKTLYIDTEHGVADLEIDPSNPNILYAAMWSFDRKPWTHRSGSERGGVYKSTDGGRTWNKLTNGLPKLIGRIGVKVAPSNPQVVYAITEAKEGTLYRSDDRGETFRQVSKETRIVSRGFYYTDLRVDPVNENRVYAVASTLFVSIDGGRTFRSITGRTHIDYHALWIDPLQPRRMWQAQDGGVAVTYDAGETWEVVNNMPLGQFYQIHADNRLPFYYVMGGLQDNGTWAGPSRTREPAGILNDDWRMISFGDGFFVVNHEDDPELYLSESQGGNIVRTDMKTREQQLIVPYMGDDGGPAENAKYRFNWNSPIVLSPHDKNTVFFGGNVVFKSADFGKSWELISPDLTTNDKQKQADAGGP